MTKRIMVKVYLDLPSDQTKVSAAKRIQDSLAHNMPVARATVETTDYEQDLTDNEVQQASTRVVRGSATGRLTHQVLPVQEIDSPAKRALADKVREQLGAEERNKCSGAEPCGPWHMCSKHSWEYQQRNGRAWNE
jgi:hypothetical protein